MIQLLSLRSLKGMDHSNKKMNLVVMEKNLIRKLEIRSLQVLQGV